MSAPKRDFFVIKRVGRYQFFDARHGMWWASFVNATQYRTQLGAFAVVQEWDLVQGCTEIALCRDIARPDTQIDDDDDPNAGEEWKKGK